MTVHLPVVRGGKLFLDFIVSRFCFLSKMELKPLSRDDLRSMYTEALAKERKDNINRNVRVIHSRICAFAGSSTKTSYTHEFSPTDKTIEIIPDIVSELQRLFPDIKIEHTQLKTLNKRGDLQVTGHVITVDWS